MTERESLQISPLFTGLTRSPMLLGITVDYLALCCLLSLCSFILASNPAYLVLYAPLHGVGWIACKIDHHCFAVLLKRIECGMTRNRALWGCQSYDVV